MNNPFEQVAHINQHHARRLAQAFAVAYDLDQVYACLRMVSRTDYRNNLSSYLSGNLFSDWPKGPEMELGTDSFQGLQYLALDYLRPK